MSITVVKGDSFQAVLNDAPVSVATMGAAVYQGDTLKLFRVVADEQPDGSGHYVVTFDSSTLDPGNYFVLWTLGTDDTTSITDPVTVLSAPVAIDGYATPAQVRDYLDVTEEAVADSALTRQIKLASDDIDSAAGAWKVWPDTARKFLTSSRPVDPLSDLQRTMLIKACCAQVEYRLLNGQDWMVQEQHDAESGPDGGVTGKVRKVAPQVYSYLQEVGLLRLSVGHRIFAGHRFHHHSRLPLA